MSIKHTFIGKNNELITKELSPLKAIRQKCLECSNWNVVEVKDCIIKDCALYPFRTGKSGIKRDLSDEQREALRKRFSNAREPQ